MTPGVGVTILYFVYILNELFKQTFKNIFLIILICYKKIHLKDTFKRIYLNVP